MPGARNLVIFCSFRKVGVCCLLILEVLQQNTTGQVTALRKDGVLVTAGGRVLGITCIADTLGEAIEKSYAATQKIGFKNAYFRKDIGARAMKAKV